MEKATLKTLFCALALAAAMPAGAVDTYVIDPTHTFARFSYLHLGLSHASGQFDKTSGTVTLDPANKSGSVDVTIDAKSVNTGVEKFDDHLKSKDFFEVDKYPTITFKSDRLKFAGDKLESVTGNLTVHGVTKPVTLKVTHFACKDHPMKKVPACGANATATIKRSEFGVGGSVPYVGDETTLSIQIEAHKQ